MEHREEIRGRAVNAAGKKQSVLFKRLLVLMLVATLWSITPMFLLEVQLSRHPHKRNSSQFETFRNSPERSFSTIIENIDCFTLNGEDYRGMVRRTRSGAPCQHWSSQRPNRHKFNPENYPLSGLIQNFCRNPSEDSAPWCFNGEKRNPEKELCDIPMCKSDSIVVNVHKILQSEGGEQERDGLHCPSKYVLDAASARAQKKYDKLSTRKGLDPTTTPLHVYSFYGHTTLSQWDHIVRAHIDRLQLQNGQSVFESGSAAGAFVDSLMRQYGVKVAGVDISQGLVVISRSRVNGTFCAASATNLDFIPDESFDHAVSFAVLMYVSGLTKACQIARELVRIVRPGGTVFLGQLNDPEMKVFKPKGPEGNWDIPRLYWYRFAYLLGLKVEVIGGENVYSKRVFPQLSHYDLHASLRYNVYLRKPLGYHKEILQGMSCQSFRTLHAQDSYTFDGKKCSFPFKYCKGGCNSSQSDGIYVDSCSKLGEVDEWCSTTPTFQGWAGSNWGRCRPSSRSPSSYKPFARYHGARKKLSEEEESRDVTGWEMKRQPRVFN
eukprot:766376-Hanusia_phi.AAC.10